MASNWYVDSAAAGTNAGTSWLNACTSISQLLALGVPPAAGDSIFIKNTSTESYASPTTLAIPGSAANPSFIYSTDATNQPPVNSDLLAGASVSTSGVSALTISGVFYCYGVTFQAGSVANAANLTLTPTAGTVQSYDTCTFTLNNTSASSLLQLNNQGRALSYFKNCTLIFGATTQAAVMNQLLMRGGSIGGSTFPTTLFKHTTPTLDSFFEGVDFSNITGTLVEGLNAGGFVYIKDCKLGVGVTVSGTPTGPDTKTFNIRSDSTATNYRFEEYSYQGTLLTSTTVVRTGGAAVEGTPVAWNITTTSNNKYAFPFESVPTNALNTVISPTTRSVTTFGLWNSASLPTNAQLWTELEYLGSSATPVGSYADNSIGNNLNTPNAASLTADSSSRWDSKATARQNTHTYSSGDIISVADATAGGGIFFCTVGGQSAGSEPVGYASAVDGGSVVDNAATFRAATRFSVVNTVTAAMTGHATVRVKAGAATATFYIDPQPVLG